MNIAQLQSHKNSNKKITMVTCYDNTSAQIVNRTAIDGVLIGDSVANVIYGHAHTINATVDMIVWHTEAVARAIEKQFIVSDLPFLSYRQSIKTTMKAVQRLMQAGAHAVKLEHALGNIETVRYIVESGVPVMGHIGLTPQFVHQLGGYKVQGRDISTANALLTQAHMLQDAGCCALVLECIPSALAQKITQQLTIPTIGIGAGPDTDGQILVWHDLLGLNPGHLPKFSKPFLNGLELCQQALNTYVTEVNQAIYPCITEHCY